MVEIMQTWLTKLNPALYNVSLHILSNQSMHTLQTIGGNRVVNDGFVGCARDYRLGGSENAIMPLPREKYNIIVGCAATDACLNKDCPENRYGRWRSMMYGRTEWWTLTDHIRTCCMQDLNGWIHLYMEVGIVLRTYRWWKQLVWYGHGIRHSHCR